MIHRFNGKYLWILIIKSDSFSMISNLCALVSKMTIEYRKSCRGETHVTFIFKVGKLQ